MNEKNINQIKSDKKTFKEKFKYINNIITGDALANLAYSSMIMLYFMFFNIQYQVVPLETATKYINISSLVFLFTSILIIEVAYKKDKENIGLYGIEFLILAFMILLIKHIPKIIGCSVQIYILGISYIFAIYYMLKTSVLYTLEKRQELINFSDIKDIVIDEPIKKASKRKNVKKEGK